MTRARFFVRSELAVGARCPLPEHIAHHAGHVLRLRDGDPIVLFNGDGGEFTARLVDRGRTAEVVSFTPVERESPLAITLLQCWIATEKLEWVAEKATELGVARIVLAPARRSVVHVDGARLEKRLERLREIVTAACCQCGRTRLPTVDAYPSLDAALAEARSNATAAFILHPDTAQALAACATSEPSAIAIGPEGGFDDAEIQLALRAGYRAVRLGPRVLRTETASGAAIALLQALAGDLR